MTNPTEREKYSVAATIAVLTFATTGERCSDLMAAHTLDGLVEMREGLLADIDEEVSSTGFYLLHEWIDGAWLATQLQTEFGASVAVGEFEGEKAIVLRDPSL